MESLTYAVLADRMRVRTDVAAELAADADVEGLAGPAMPAGLGGSFWRVVHREAAITYALLVSAPSDAVEQIIERASLRLAVLENAATCPVERAAVQVVLHELRADVASWRERRQRESQFPPTTRSA